MTKAPTPKEESKKQRDNTKTPTKTSITQRLRTDLGRSVGATTITQLVCLNWSKGSQPSHLPQKLSYQKDTHSHISKYQGMFVIQSQEKMVLTLEKMQVPNGIVKMYGGVSVLRWLSAPVAMFYETSRNLVIR